jgi:hypothetical protein
LKRDSRATNNCFSGFPLQLLASLRGFRCNPGYQLSALLRLIKTQAKPDRFGHRQLADGKGLTQNI